MSTRRVSGASTILEGKNNFGRVGIPLTFAWLKARRTQFYRKRIFYIVSSASHPQVFKFGQAHSSEKKGYNAYHRLK